MAKFTIEVETVADDSDLRRQLADALAAVEEWRKIATARETTIDHALYEIEGHVRDYNACARERDAARSQWSALQAEIEGAATTRAELASARAEIERLQGEVKTHSDARGELARVFREELATVRAASRRVEIDRDRAIAERDEARKALAGYEWTEGNAAQVAALRARVAELERINDRMLSQLDDVARAITAR